MPNLGETMIASVIEFVTNKPLREAKPSEGSENECREIGVICKGELKTLFADVLDAEPANHPFEIRAARLR